MFFAIENLNWESLDWPFEQPCFLIKADFQAIWEPDNGFVDQFASVPLEDNNPFPWPNNHSWDPGDPQENQA